MINIDKIREGDFSARTQTSEEGAKIFMTQIVTMMWSFT